MGAYEGKIGAFMGERWRPFATWKLIPILQKKNLTTINASEQVDNTTHLSPTVHPTHFITEGLAAM
ncbi:hypothetical protein Goklo_010204, partial [Gossypium klotzschianum]|nr:hypothetical protein [Gossypium klotzschianum]